MLLLFETPTGFALSKYSMNESFPKSMICGRSSHLPTQPDRLF
ncbi:hypothetical protein Hanom_Chr03g00250201 [Helianthus anomalus]